MTTTRKSVVRYMRVGRLLSWLKSGELHLSSPADWHDEVEKFWFLAAERRLGLEEAKLRRKIFGACFSTEYYSEALWKRFGDHDDIVRVTIDHDTLIRALEAWKAESDAVYAIGPVDYRHAKEAAKAARAVLRELKSHAKKSTAEFRKRLLDLWFVKTAAFEFEQESRVLVHLAKPQPSGKTVTIPLLPAACITRVLFDNRIERAHRDVLEAHLKGAIPEVSVAGTVVNRVPKALEAIAKKAEPKKSSASR